MSVDSRLQSTEMFSYPSQFKSTILAMVATTGQMSLTDFSCSECECNIVGFGHLANKLSYNV